ncbi:hypothetical protein GCM10007301_21970 [Azorhizobium oxalatiphilum]|uniref:Uncharacterized protein n=1 Tax=Azorhizobium oxalatiphilum TaxID=980631 RepID=A0A917BYL1_9HYPH|nr:hypothetical protein GCM10007301_21970 [Azorhizobium oxalatiphilum]
MAGYQRAPHGGANSRSVLPATAVCRRCARADGVRQRRRQVAAASGEQWIIKTVMASADSGRLLVRPAYQARAAFLRRFIPGRAPPDDAGGSRRWGNAEPCPALERFIVSRKR